MASRNERRRRASQRAKQAGEAGHDVIERSEDTVGASAVRIASRVGKIAPTQIIIETPEAIEKAEAESRQPKRQTNLVWDPDKTISPPIEPTALWSIYETNAIHSGAINAKVADSVGRGWKLLPEDPDEKGANDDLPEVTRELNDVLRAVCTDLTFTQLVRQAVTELEAMGWSDWEILRQNAGDVTSEIIGILPVPAQFVRACKNSDNVFAIRRGEKVVYYKRFGFEKHVNAESGDVEGENGYGTVPEADRANELVHFKHYTPRSSWYGIPPWVAALPPIAEMTAMREFNVSFFESGGMADRHIHVSSKDEKVAEELAGKIVEQLEDARGVAHTSVVTHSDENTEVEVNSLEPKSTQTAGGKESSFLSGRAACTEEILTAHGVPPYRVAIAKVNSLGGNVSDSMDDDYRYGTVEPLQEIIEAELTRTIFGPLGFADMLAGWEFEFEDKTQDDTDDEHDRLMDDQEHGVKSPNDVREAKGDERIDDPAMDAHYISGQPITQTGDASNDPKKLLAELKQALEAAIAAAGGSGEGSTDEALDDETGLPDDGNASTVNASERKGVFRGWNTLRRR